MGFVLSFLAGISTVLGFLVIYINTDNKDSIICKSLAFAAGVMASVSLFDLLPNSLVESFNKYSFIFAILISIVFLLIGICTSHVIDKMIPERYEINSSDLYKSGILTAITSIMHNIPEGIITFLSTQKSFYLGLKVSVAIALHNIPEGISIAIPIYYSTKNKFKTLLYTIISGMSEFVGALLAFLFLKNIKIPLGFFNSFIAGVMIDLSIRNLLPHALKYNAIECVFYFILGIFIMCISHLFI